MRTRCALGVLVAVLWAGISPANETARIGGQLRVAVEGLELADAGSIVVFLEVLEGTGPAADVDLAPAAVRQNGARFDPTFLAVAVGQLVEMPNDDVIFHNVFSYSEPNDFDLGMYASGQSRSLRFEHSGLVRIYCSIHESMDGLIFVAPSRLFVRPDASGRYAIEGVAPGRYRLHVWSERFPEWVRPVEIDSNVPRTFDPELGRQAR
jgi:plastocyanin